MIANIDDILVILITLLAVGYGLGMLVRWLGRNREGFDVTTPIVLGFSLRVAAFALVSLTGFADFLRGPDEIRFMEEANELVGVTLGSSAWIDVVATDLHVAVFALQIDLFDSPETALRIAQCGIAMAGVALFAAAVHELAGGRAAVIAAWLMALEPSGVFFGSILHKESLMFLAGGLVAYGSAMIWKRTDPRWLLLIALGCLVAVGTRSYAGWFLIAAGAAVTLHAGLRSESGRGFSGLSLVAVAVLIVSIAAPTVLEASTEDNLLGDLQSSQEANANDESNLGLEQVDFSTRGAVIVNLPGRIVDVLTRPYLWQVENISQQLAVLGSLVMLTVLALLIQACWWRRGEIMSRAGPLIYVGSALLVAYSLSAGNAGTAFRYRTHILVPAICALVVLRYAPDVVRRRRSAGAPAIGGRGTVVAGTGR